MAVYTNSSQLQLWTFTPEDLLQQRQATCARGRKTSMSRVLSLPLP
jgi:hypothetical protein